MKKQWKTHLYFTKSERNGVVALGFFCLLLLVIPKLFRFWKPAPEVDFSAFEQIIADTIADVATAPMPEPFYFNPNTLPVDSFLLLGLDKRTASAIERYRQKGGRFNKPADFARIYTLSDRDYKRLASFIRIPGKNYSWQQQTRREPHYTRFNPNTVSYEEILNMGVPAKTAHTWVNFRNKGGKFRQAEDLRKLYGLSAAQYERLAPWVNIPAKADTATRNIRSGTVHKTPRKQVRIDVNRATAAEWEELDGIGPAFARKITGFRDKLGGFANIDQVAETHGLPDSVFQFIRPQLDWSPLFRTININTADETTLSAHPYLSKREAKAIVNYRNQNGPFRHTDDLQRLHALSPATLERIKPYLGI